MDAEEREDRTHSVTKIVATVELTTLSGNHSWHFPCSGVEFPNWREITLRLARGLIKVCMMMPMGGQLFRLPCPVLG
jgi:hypothetical protein